MGWINYKKIRLIIIQFLLLSLFFPSLCFSKNIHLEAQSGQVDLSKIDLSKDLVKISGEFEFYANKFYDNSTLPLEKNYENIPISWTTYEDELIDGGYGTYSFNISGLEIGKQYGFKLNGVYYSYKLYIDDKLIFENGKVSETKKFFKPDIIPRTVFFEAKNNKINVLLQLSSFNARKGGLLDRITFGEQNLINNKKIKAAFFDSFIFGAIAFMSVYHFVLFFLMRKEKSNLYFALFTLAIVFRTVGTNERMMFYIHPDLIEPLFIRLDVVSAFFAVPFFLNYFHSIYEEFEKTKTFKILVGFGYFLCLVTLVTPNRFFLKYTIVTSYFYIALAVLFILKNIFINWKKLQSKYFAYGFVVIIIGIVNDALLNMQKINSINLVPFCLVIFLLVQAVYLARTFIRAFQLAEKLTINLTVKNRENLQLNKQLEHQNDNLEKKIAERVREVHTKNIELEEKNMKITSSISYAKIIQNSTLPNISDMKKSLKDLFVIWRPRDIVGGDFYWHEERNDVHYIAVGDCTGHGVPGALMSMLSKATLDRIVTHEPNITTPELLRELNMIMKSSLYKDSIDLISDDGLDIGILKIEPKENKFTFSGAKLNLYYSEKGTIKKLKGDRHSVGYRRSKKDYQYNEFEFSTLQDKVFYLTTDGFEDQNSLNNHKMFGRKNLVKMLEEVHHMDFEDQKPIIEEKLEKFMDGEEQRDDITLLGFKF